MGDEIIDGETRKGKTSLEQNNTVGGVVRITEKVWGPGSRDLLQSFTIKSNVNMRALPPVR